MNRVVIVVAAGAVVLGGAAGVYVLTRPPAGAPAPTPIAAAAPTPTSAPESSPTAAATPAAPTLAPSATPTPDAAPTMATLMFESDVPETSVFIDRVYIGIAPLTAPNVTPGSHRLNLSAAGYDGFVETIDVEPGPRTLSYKFKEVRLDATLAVVHKHAIGSCTGTLHATPQGLTYDTTDKDDAFTVTLTDLETFVVDYLAKNLKVKIKKGKSYNFTDPDGKADRLYLFHGDVEKARQRILSGK